MPGVPQTIRMGFMVARCIHLDTLDPAGTPLDQVELQHLDLAINVYRGEHRAARFAQTLRAGKVQDASFRTHLFRIERAPFASARHGRASPDFGSPKE